MPRFPERDSHYSNVNRIADEQGLIWDGQYGSPYGIEKMIAEEYRDEARLRDFRHLFDHTKRFKPRGSGQRRIVMAISSPYLRDDAKLQSDVDEFARLFHVSARVNDPRDRVYMVDATLPILFWRPDLHTLR